TTCIACGSDCAFSNSTHWSSDGGRIIDSQMSTVLMQNRMIAMRSKSGGDAAEFQRSGQKCLLHRLAVRRIISPPGIGLISNCRISFSFCHQFRGENPSVSERFTLNISALID